MQNRYQRMTKEEKLKIRDKYKNTEKGLMMMPRLNRLLIIGGIGYAVTIYLIYSEITGDNNIWNYIWAISLFIFSTIFIGGSLYLRGVEYNKQALKEPFRKNQEKKSKQK